MAKEREEIAELEEETELLNSDDVSEEKVQELLKKTEEEEAAEEASLSFLAKARSINRLRSFSAR